MNIIIDTSILRTDRGFLNSDILLLKKLAKLELLKIHFPWVVFKESTSQNLLEVDSGLNRAIKEISSMNRKGISNDDYDDLQKIATKLEKIKSELPKSIDKHWSDFVTDSKSILHKINEEHGQKVMTSYFIGETPFPEPKSRKDIPDAFIYEAILSIRNEYGDVHFICHDKNLRESIKKTDNCFAFDSYSTFYDSVEYKSIELEYKKIEHFSDELISLKDNVKEISEFALSEIQGDVFAGDDQEIFHENIPSDDNMGMLQSMDNVEIEKIHLDKIQFIDGVFYVPIDISAIFGIDYFIFKADYYLSAEERNISIIDNDWNKHYFLVQESFKVKLSYKCSIEQECIKDDYFEFSSEPAIIEELIIIEK